MTEQDILVLFKKTGALLEGHFLLSSGLHSDRYIQCAQVLQHPQYAELLCAELGRMFTDERPTVVVGPALGGVVVSYEVARALKVKSLFTERDKNGSMVLRRNFVVSSSDRVLVVEDVITTAGSAKEVIAVVRSAGAAVIGVGCLADRTQGESGLDVALKSLVRLSFQAYEAGKCPLCRLGSAPVKPGSRT